MKVKTRLLLLTIVFIVCIYMIVKNILMVNQNQSSRVEDPECMRAKEYCESLLEKDEKGSVLVIYTTLRETYYKEISCNDWSEKCNWYPMD